MSAFDWMWLRVVQAPRGTVELTGHRGAAARVFSVEPGLWDAQVRPWMPDAVLKDYLRGQSYLKDGEMDAAVRSWKKALTAARNQSLRGWIWLRVGKARVNQREWEEAHKAYRSALEEINGPFPKSVLWRAIGEAYETQVDLDLARKAHTTARALREKGWGKSLLVAESLSDLGAVEFHSESLELGFSFNQRALSIRKELAPDSLEVAQSLSNLGRLHSNRGEMDQAVRFHQQALKIRQNLAPDSLTVAYSMNNLGQLAEHRGDLETATKYHQRALEIKKKVAPHSLTMANSWNNLGLLASKRGDFDQAIELYQRALEIRQELSLNGRSVAESLNNIAAMHLKRGNLSQAEDFLQRSLEIKEKLQPNSLSLSYSLNNLAAVATQRGDMDRAMGLLERAMDIRKRIAPHSLEVVAVFNNLGFVASYRRNLERAKHYYHLGLTLSQKLAPESIQVSTILNNLGAVAELNGDLERAVNYYQSALEIEERVAPDGLRAAITLNNLGAVAERREEWERAIDLHDRALSIGQTVAPGGLEVANGWYHLGRVASKRTKAAAAIDYLLRALEIQETLAPNSIYLAETLHALGLAHRDLAPSQLESASEFFNRSLDVLDHQMAQLGGSHKVRGGFRARRDSYYHRALEVQLELGQPEVAFNTLERSRARSFLEQFAERDIMFTVDIPEELDQERRRAKVRFARIQRQLAELSSGEDTAQIKDLQAQLRQASDEAKDVEEKIRRTFPRLADLHNPEPLTLEAARSTLDPGTLMLSYSVGEESTVLFVVTQEQFAVHTLPVAEADLRRWVNNFTADVERMKDSRNVLFKGLLLKSRHLYETLILPVADAVAASNRLLIVPDGPLHQLPFAALIGPREEDPEDSRGWRYLAESKPIHFVLSATVYAELKRRPRPRGNHGSPLLAAFGDPFFGDDHLRWDPLPFTREEIMRIAGLHRNTQTFLGEGATEEQLKSLSRDVRILHLATHGSLDNRFPMNSSVVLTLPEGPSEGRENGYLQAWEIFEGIRLDADLVVLSACQSAQGEEQGGEGLLGLTRAFQYAGARTVAATLWSVNDLASAELMASFYRRLNNGLSKAEALQAAQIELIGSEAGYSAPYFWAGFQLYGDWR